MKVLCWNLTSGGGKRLARIVEEVAAHDADVVAFTEFRAGPGRELIAEMKERGWDSVETTRPAGNGNGTAVFSRTPVEATRRDTRWLEVALPECGVRLGVLHIVAASGGALGRQKAEMWQEILRYAEKNRDSPVLLMGNWNTGIRGVDEIGKTFVCSEHFARLPELGWTDLWRRDHPGQTEWTARSKRNAYRLDHAFASAALEPRVVACRYSHREREARVSTHSMVVVEIEGTT